MSVQNSMEIIGYKVLVRCNEELVSDFASDPSRTAGLLFQHGLISDETNRKVNELNVTTTDKARFIVQALQDRAKGFPRTYTDFIGILTDEVAKHGEHQDLLRVVQETESSIVKEISDQTEQGKVWTTVSTPYYETC